MDQVLAPLLEARKCRKCWLVLPLDQFHQHPECRAGRQHMCKECANKARHQYRLKNPGREKDYRQKYQIRRTILERKRKYGLSEAAFTAMLEAQESKCSSCRRHFDATVTMCVDHCYNTGVVRGILCKQCNHAEGLLKTPATARRLAEYMERKALFYFNGN
jgi:hypothetical protein